jgi:long-chain acyl-CoA synthetase
MSSLGAALERTVQQHGRKVAMVDADGQALHWQGWRALVASSTGWLAAKGLQPGQRFGILGLNSSRFAALLQAGFRGGFIPVPINHRLAAVEIAAILQQSSCALLLVDRAFAALADSPALATWQGGCVQIPDTPWAGQVAASAPVQARPVPANAEALLLYTGGTSGRAKGVPLSHAQILANALQVGSVLAPRADDVVLHVAPMFHSAELVLAGYALHGAAQAYLPRFTPQDFLAAVQRHQVTVTLLVPAMLIMLLRSGLLATSDVSSLRRVIYGASPLPPDAIALMAQMLPGVQLTQGYGLTETAPLLTMLDSEDHRRAQQGEHPQRLASCGRALPAVDLRIVDALGHEVAPGGVGEIFARGPNVCTGYLDDPQATAEAWPGDAFATGDIGRMDEEGYLYLLDRRKDMVITGSENVYSVEVEAVLLQHPAVADAAVIGVPDALYGEAVHGVVVFHPGAQADAAALQQFCRAHLGGYKIPRSFSVVPALPRTAMGKVMKSALRAQHAP